MNIKETIQSNEKFKSFPEKIVENKNRLNEEFIRELFIKRNRTLETIKPFVYLNFYYYIEGKIKKEEESFLRILNTETDKREALRKYSFVLNPQYFEQRFLSRQ